MTPGRISARVVGQRLAWVERMLAGIRALPLQDQDAFVADAHALAAAESYLRRALEAMLDLGRHLLSRGFGEGVSEYREIATRLEANRVLDVEEARLLRLLAGYRNRLVHFYHEVGADELYDICARRLPDVERVVAGYRRWLGEHRDRLDDSL